MNKLDENSGKYEANDVVGKNPEIEKNQWKVLSRVRKARKMFW